MHDSIIDRLMTWLKMTEVDFDSDGESLHNILTPISIVIICISFTVEVWLMGINKQISDIVDLQQSFDMRRDSFPLL